MGGTECGTQLAACVRRLGYLFTRISAIRAFLVGDWSFLKPKEQAAYCANDAPRIFKRYLGAR